MGVTLFWTCNLIFIGVFVDISLWNFVIQFRCSKYFYIPSRTAKRYWFVSFYLKQRIHFSHISLFLYIMCHDLSIALNCSTSCQLFVWINTDNVFINLELTTVLGWLNFSFCLMLQSLRYNLQSDTFNLIVWSVEK